MRLHHLLLAAIVALMPVMALADGRELATKNFRELETLAPSAVVSGDLIPVYDASTRKVKKMSATALPLGGSYDSSAITFSTALTGNPLLQTHYQNITTAQANAGVTVLASTSGKTVYPGAGFSIYASGTASGATSVSIKCSGGNIIATFPIALLVDDVPVGPFVSTGVTRGPALTDGCPVSEAILVSATGTLATTTNLLINIPYTVQ